MLVGLEKTTLVNFPGRVASAIFLPGCNMRCPFCYNAELALASSVDGIKTENSTNQFYSLEDVFIFLEKRKHIISGVVITGGEPFASPHLQKVIEQIKKLNLALKIDTNGLFPKILKELLLNEILCPQMVAIDIKTSPNRYIELMGNTQVKSDTITKKVIESLNILRDHKVAHPNFMVDYRTVLVPTLVGEKEIKEMASFIPEDASWNFAEFMNANCLNHEWNNLKPYSNNEVEHLVKIAQSRVKHAKLR